MKLQDLRAAIRGIKGNPSITVELVPGVPVELVPQKTALLKALGDAYQDNRAAETGLTIDANGVMRREGAEPAAPARNEAEDEDDLL